MINRHLLAAAAALALAAPLAAQAPEEAAAGAGIEDIVVTAQRRRETLQTVPIAISAFSGQQLRSQGVQNTLQLTTLIPNLVAQNNTGPGSANGYFLRGVGNTESIATFDPPVGTYVDDVYLSRQSANNLAFFDIERVEVLRGPQGTLFGRNTTGGAINVILREPGERLGGYAEVGYGRFDRKVARASIDLPLAPTFSVKLSGFWQNDDGYVKNTTTGDRLNDDDGWGVRGAMRGELNERTTFNASYAHIASKAENLQNFECDPGNPANCDGRWATTGFSEGRSATRFAGLNIRGRKANYGLGNNTSLDLVTAKLDFGLGERTTLTLITGYVSTVSQFTTDVFDSRLPGTLVAGLPATANPSFQNPSPALGRGPRGGFAILTDNQADQFSQEVKLVGTLGDNLINYVAGLYYIREKNRTDLGDVLQGAVVGDRIVRNGTEAKAGYLQADWNVTEAIKLTAGVRYTDEEKTLDISDNRPTCAPAVCLSNANLIAANGVRIPDRQRAKLWTPRFAVNVKPSRDILLFASATRGFKSGGWNARGTTNSAFLPFDPEKVWSYEAGVKSDLFDRRVRLNVTAFYLDVTGLQTQNAAVGTNGALVFTTRNFADFRNKGLEAELTVVPVTGLNLFATAGYQDAKYRLPKNAPLIDQYGFTNVAALVATCQAALAAGRIPTIVTPSPNGAACGNGIVKVDGTLAKPVRTPKFSLALGGSYDLALGDGGMSLVPSVNASYRSKQEVGTNNLSIYTGALTGVGTNGLVYTVPSNPYGGTFIAGSRSPAVWFLNGGVTLNGPDKAWELAANCLNCLGESRPTSTVSNTLYLNPPMTWLLTARYNF